MKTKRFNFLHVYDICSFVLREFFSIDELVQRPLPEGVNPSKLETYLSDDDFNVSHTTSIAIHRSDPSQPRCREK